MAEVQIAILAAVTLAVLAAVALRAWRDMRATILRAQEAHRHALAEGKLLFDTLPVGVASMADRVITRANRQLEEMLGYGPGELDGQSSRILYPSEEIWREAGERYRYLQGGGVLDGEFRLRRKDGSAFWCRAVARALNPDSPAASVIITYSDTSERHAAERALRRSESMLRLAVDAAELIYWEWDRDADQLHWGRDPSPIVGSTPEGRSMRWTKYLDLVHPEDRERYLERVNTAWEQAGPCFNEYRVVRQDGQVLWLSSHARTLADASGRVRRMIGVSQDITERKHQEEEARYLAYHDTLTGLPNRRLLDDRLRQALLFAQRRDSRVALLVVDLDNFKQVNDALGHRAGDAVLREAAHRVAGCLRKADTLARHGGDEFVVVIPDLQLDADVQVVAEKILRSLEPAFRVDGREFSIGASIGVSLFPGDTGDGEALLRNADVAMYRAKQLGRNNYRFYGR